jgi:concanavalin A-like lectin/glucanase superfamily protein
MNPNDRRHPLLPRAARWMPLLLALGVATSARADITTGLVDYWQFNETSGTTAVDSAGSNNVLLSGGTTFAPGRSGNSLNFTSASNYAVTTSAISYEQYTIDFWMKVNAFTGLNPRMVGPRDGNQTWIVLNNETNEGVGFYYNHGANTIQDPNPPPLGVWENYAATIDLVAHTAAIFRNGVQVASGTFTDNVPLLPWVMGHNQDPNNPADFFTGQLDSVRIYDRVLTSSDIVQLVPEPSGVALAACAVFCLAGLAVRRVWRTARLRAAAAA